MKLKDILRETPSVSNWKGGAENREYSSRLDENEPTIDFVKKANIILMDLAKDFDKTLGNDPKWNKIKSLKSHPDVWFGTKNEGDILVLQSKLTSSKVPDFISNENQKTYSILINFIKALSFGNALYLTLVKKNNNPQNQDKYKSRDQIIKKGWGQMNKRDFKISIEFIEDLLALDLES